MADAPETAQLMTELARLLRALGKTVRTHVQATAEASGLTPPQMWALQHLDDSCHMGALGDRLGIDKSYVTAIVDGLERAGLVERQPDPGDRRVRNLVLTEEGRRVRVRFERDLVAGLPFGAHLSTAELAQLNGLLGKALPGA